MSEVEPVIEPKVRPDRKGPFANPNTEAPPPRSGAQLDEQALRDALATAEQHAAQGRESVAMQTLRKCANKIPQSVECEANLAMLMLTTKQQRAHARYYLKEAAEASPATADDRLYRALGAAAMKAAQFDAARAAFGVLSARETATVDDLTLYAHALQAAPESADEAADVYAKAYSLDPTRHELIRKQATLLAQSGDNTRAADLFERYLAVAKPNERARTALEQRIETLRASGKTEAAAKTPRSPRATSQGTPPNETGSKDLAE